jgi:hypothetical protein
VRTRLLAASLALVLAAGVAACSDDGASPDGTASITVLLTDAPGDVDKAWVDLSEIYLQGGGPEGGPFTLVEASTGWIELTELAGETLLLASGVEVPAGSYGQLRFRVERAALLTMGDGLYTSPGAGELPDEVAGRDPDGTLHCPSCGQSGLKANMPGGALQAPGGGSTVVVLDLDVDQSYGHEAGTSGKWVMHPVMNVLALELSGRIEGTVTLAAEVTIPECNGEARDVTDFVPLATAAAVFSAEVQGDGTYAFPHLPPGSYVMSWDEVTFGDPPAWTLGFVADVDVTPAQVASGATTTVNYTITDAVCEQL